MLYALKSHSSATQTLVSWLLKEAEKLHLNLLFKEFTVRDLAFGYPDFLLGLAKMFDPKRFYTDVVGIFAGVSLFMGCMLSVIPGIS